jgi:phage gp46-like protein
MSFTDLDLQTGTEYDLGFTETGDLAVVNSFDTAIIQSLFCDARDQAGAIASKRRGWHGNENLPTEQGGLLWTLDQSRLTTDTVNKVNDIARKALSWLIDNNFAKSVTTTAVRGHDKITLTIVITRFDDSVESRNYTIWQATG